MTKEEAIELMAILKAAYPNSYNNMTKQEAMGVVTVWALQFADMPADIVYMALQKAISTCKFPPSISEVKSKLGSLYWEAWEAMNRDLVQLSAEKRKALQRICAETSDHKHGTMYEVKVGQMLPEGNGMLTLNGT